MTIIYFILILSVTVFIHELGHFLFAKKYGVYVYEFSIGMGPKLFKFNRKNDETNYCVRLLPIGGFVQMAGEEVEVDEKIPVEKRLQSKTLFERFMIMVAGVMMNFLLAIAIFFIIGLFNNVSVNNVYIDSSAITNLNDGDKIVEINGNFVNNYDKLALELAIASSKESFLMTVKDSKGNKKNIQVVPVEVGGANLPYGKDYGFEVNDLNIVSSNISGLKKGAKIVKVNDINIDSYSKLLQELSNIKEDKLSLTVQLKDETFADYEINIKTNNSDESIGYSYGFYITGDFQKGLLSAFKYAFFKFFSTIEQMIFTIFYLITGKLSLNMMSGPIGIFNVVSIYSKYGISNILALLALICVNVGFINVLPLPAFDGGHILFLSIEKIRGKKLSPKVENTIHNIGFILLMVLMIVITYNDIIRLF